VLVLQKKGNLMELVDPKLGSGLKNEEAIRMIKIALLCTSASPAFRPTMSAVVSILEGQTIVDEVTMDPSIYGDELGFNALKDRFEQLQLAPMSTSGSKSLMHSSVMTWADLLLHLPKISIKLILILSKFSIRLPPTMLNACSLFFFLISKTTFAIDRQKK
jgi:hypothetical protein